MIFLVRHGQADFKRSQEAGLTAHGKKQAKTVAKHLLRSSVRPQRIICGDLLRQRQTAVEIVSEMRRLLGGPVRTEEDPRLNEVEFPELARHCERVIKRGGPTASDGERLGRKVQSVLRSWRAGRLVDTETPTQLMRRVRPCLSQLRGMKSDVVVVTSVGVLDTVLRWCLDIPLDIPDTNLRSGWHNCGISSIEWPLAARHPRIVTLNEVGHLPQQDRQRVW